MARAVSTGKEKGWERRSRAGQGPAAKGWILHQPAASHSALQDSFRVALGPEQGIHHGVKEAPRRR